MILLIPEILILISFIVVLPTLANVSSHNILYGEYYYKDDGKQYMKVTNPLVSLNIGSSSARLEDTGDIHNYLWLLYSTQDSFPLLHVYQYHQYSTI